MNFEELKTGISLIESKYPHHERNTVIKMISLIKKEFNVNISEHDILNFYNLHEDYKRISDEVEYGINIETGFGYD